MKVPDVVVAREWPLFYDEQDPRKRVEPDILVVLDHEVRSRSSYIIRDERKPPDVAMEVLSPRSGIRNREAKRDLYAFLGIKEYFLFQPNMERAEPRLVGYRLREKEGENEYVELEHDPAAGPDGALRSDVLGVSLRPDGARVRLRNLTTGADYAWPAEKIEKSAASEKKVAAAEGRARREAKARHVAEKRAAAAEGRARSEAEARHVAEARARCEAKARHASDETAAAAVEKAKLGQARIAKLEALLAAAGIQLPDDL